MSRAHEKDLELLHEVRPDVPDALIGDAALLSQVVISLVSNALKFTHHGEIAVHVELEKELNDCQRLVVDAASVRDETDEIIRNALASGSQSDRMSEQWASALRLMGLPGTPDDSVWLRFTVRDTGIGIPANRLDALFQPFTQADSSTIREYGGTGLGLAISARLVELMGGRIGLESEEGHGTQFHFTKRFARQSTAVTGQRHFDATKFDKVFSEKSLRRSTSPFCPEIEGEGAKWGAVQLDSGNRRIVPRRSFARGRELQFAVAADADPRPAFSGNSSVKVAP